MKKGVLIVALAMAPALNAKEKERFATVEAGYNAVSHRTTFSYPDADEKFVSGTSFQGNGVHGAVGMKLSSVVSVGARFDHNFLRQPIFYSISSDRKRRSEPNYGERAGASQRAEAVVGFRIKKIGVLEGGVARHSFARRWTFRHYPSEVGGRPKTFDSAQDTISWGPVIGLTREVWVKGVTLGGGIWGYPRMAQTQEWRDIYNSWHNTETASAIKAEATVAYHLTARTAAKVGYQFFRTFTSSPSSAWRINTARTEHAVIARFVFMF